MHKATSKLCINLVESHFRWIPILASIKFSHTLLSCSAPPPKQAIRFQQPPSWFYDLREKYVITNAIVIQGIGRRACNEKRENSKVFLAVPRSCQIKCGIGTCCFFKKNQKTKESWISSRLGKYNCSRKMGGIPNDIPLGNNVNWYKTEKSI